MATKLGLYNDALVLHLGERKLVTLNDNNESRRVLDQAWDRSGVINGGPLHCIELGFWNFATRTQAISYSPSVEPAFGFVRAFDKPEDWLRTVAVASDGYFRNRLVEYADEGDFWFADFDVLYVKYISRDPLFGTDLSLWPLSFCEFISLYLADHAKRIAKSEARRNEITLEWERAKKKANNIDGMNKPTAMRQLGTWASSRLGSSTRTSRTREG
jgi:hypothetical protein